MHEYYDQDEFLLENEEYYTFDKNKLFSLFLLIIILFFIEIYNYNMINDTKVTICLCTLGKRENKYIREFVDYYRNIGVDKIILYDNNDEDDEKFEDVISDDINFGFVEIKNYRGKNSIQIDSINDCLKENIKKYSWILVNDIDEFLHVKEGYLKKFLLLDRLKKCNVIHFNWRHHTDSNQLYYKNESLFKRFPEIKKRYPETVKSMIRGEKGKKYVKTGNHHVLRYNYSCCNAYGETYMENDFINGIQIKNPDYKDYYFDHFYTKSAEEYIEKKNRGDCFFGKDKRIDLYAIEVYFAFNTITLEKIDFFENRTGLNLSNFREKLKNE